MGRRIGVTWKTYSDLEVHKLLGKGAHFVVEAKPVFARLASCEDKVALSLFPSIHDYLVIGAHDLVVNIERSSGLNLRPPVLV